MRGLWWEASCAEAPPVLLALAPSSSGREAHTHRHEGIHSQDGQVRIALGVVDQVQVHEFLDLQVVWSFRRKRGVSP